MNDDNKLKAGASWYGSKGWKILPCHGLSETGTCTCGGKHTETKDIGKHPVIAEWQIKSTDDVQQIASWWSDGSPYNVAVNCRPSGFFVIDIDPRSGGDESYAKLVDLLEGEIPSTVEAITGEYVYNGKTVRGRHMFFKYDSSETLKGRFEKDENLPGIDIKTNGYVMLAPSRHVSGVNYEWRPGHAPWEMEMAEVNDAMLEVLRKKGSKRSGGGLTGFSSTSISSGGWEAFNDLEWNGEKLDIDRFLEEGIDEGSRAVDIYALACALANKIGTDAAARMAIESLMLRFNHEKVRPPLEVEGPGGLMMHVNRAIDFVAQNPKTTAWGPSLTEWQKNFAGRSEQEHFQGMKAPEESTSEPRDEDETEEFEYTPGSIGGAVARSVGAGKSVMDASSQSNMNVPKDVDALREADGGVIGGRSLTDVGNGRRIVDTFGPGIRYTPVLGWFYWNGTHWKRDAENLHLRELAKKVAAAIASEIVNVAPDDAEGISAITKWAVQAKSASRIKAAIESATSDERIVVPLDKWDSNPYLLGVKNGVVDLKTGALMQGNPDLLITRHSPIAYTPGLTHPKWVDFLEFGTEGDKEYQDYIQRAFGYTLTGLKTLDIMFLIQGRPGSGKNTLIESFAKSIGMSEYAYPMESTVLAQDDGRSNNTDSYHYAELIGKRCLWVDELPELERLKENAVKRLTGSSTISARSPGEKPINFESQAKLWITTNHKPMITDDAMWRRMRVLPWNRIPKVSDPGLKAFLSDPEFGLPVILSWAIEGAKKFLASTDIDPLGMCNVVQVATDSYKQNEDRMGMFLRQELVEDPTKVISIKRVMTIYRMWCEDRGEKPMTQTSFTRKIVDRQIQLVGQDSEESIVGYDILTKAAPVPMTWEEMQRFSR